MVRLGEIAGDRTFIAIASGDFALKVIKLRWPRWLLALICGLLMGCTVAPVGLFPLAWVALAPLWTWVRSPLVDLSSSGRRWGVALWPPFLWGMGYHGLALIWITHLHPMTWLGIPWLGSLAIAIGAWLFITLWGAAIVVTWSVICRGLWRWTDPVGAPTVASTALAIAIGTAVWCGLEWLWSLGPLYWTSLSYTQSPHNLALLHIGQLSGPLTVTAVLVAVNGVLAEAWRCDHRAQSGFNEGRSQEQRSLRAAPLYLSAVLLLLSAEGIGLGLQHSAPPPAPGSEVRVGLIQGNLPNRVKLSRDGIRLAEQRYTTSYLDLVAQGADIVLTPEGALPIIWNPSWAAQSPLYQAVQRSQIPLWLGTFMPAGDRITQSLITLTGQAADPVSRYNKTKLVPLGEYLPFETLLGRVINRLSTMSYGMMPGNFDQIFATPWGQAAIGICYESAFPGWFQRQVQQGAEFILTASNNDPYPAFMMQQHHAQDVMRAVENRRWMVRVTNTGISGVVTPQGQTLWQSERGTYTTHLTTIARRTDLTLYARWGNWLTPLLLISSGFFSLRALRRRSGEY